ncbi:MAG: EAL domain-containing protein [Clostridia bacterium]|nr:EAL domain-containing protein [Clostridia bacterium]
MKFFKKFSGRIIFVAVIALMIYSVLVGFMNYTTAKNALVEKGKINLKNGVLMAKDYIEVQYDAVNAGVLTEADAMESIKETLLGPMDENNTRILHQKIDLGKNGYFIIYNKEGYEIMHPTLEGSYVYDVVDYSEEQKAVVKEQIEVGLNGGGYTYYTWTFPYSTKVGEKVSYVSYMPEWQWVIVATAYEDDFIEDAKLIVRDVTLFSIGLIVILSFVLSFFIQKLTQPLRKIVKGMENISKGVLENIHISKSSEEVEILSKGYNQMIDSLVVAKDAIDKKTMELKILAYHDTLTGLPNRMAMKKSVSKFLDERISGIFILVDIANLQSINSTLGYQQGDLAIKTLSGYLKSYESDQNFVARSGSNEFSVWLTETEEKNIHQIVVDLVEKLKDNFKFEGYKPYVDIHSVYFHYKSSDTDNFEMIYEKVSTAMHLAKKDNDFKIHSYDETMKSKLEYEVSMRSLINKGIQQKEFVPYYQKKVNYVTGEVLGFEALARWFSSELGFVPPNVFIPFLIKFNKEAMFLDLFMEIVLNDLHELQERYGEHMSVSINVSSNYFLAEGFVEKVRDVVERYHVKPGHLIFEITEDVIIGDTKMAASIVSELHKIGINVSIDDFGTGYSSLNYLLTLNPDEIKIDKSIVDQILTSDKSFYLFNTVCEMAETFGYHIVAEGVETLEQIEKIKETSLTTIQGYYYSKPEPLENLK